MQYQPVLDCKIIRTRIKKEKIMERGSRKQKQMKAIKPLVALAALLLCMFCMSMGQAEAAEQPVAALPFPTNGQWSEEYWITDDILIMWHRIEVPSDGCLSFKIMSYAYGTHYELYNEDLSSKVYDGMTYGSEISPDTKTHEFVLSTGTYYIKVFTYSYSGSRSRGKYKLYAGFESYHTNDSKAVSFDSPQDVALGELVTGAFTHSDKEDWYRVSIPAKGYYHYQVSAYLDDVKYELYNEDLSTKKEGHSASGSDMTPGTMGHDAVLSPGTYYFKFYSFNRYGKYTFVISALNKANCDHDYKTNIVDSTYTRKGYTMYKCEKCGDSYKGDYTAKKTLNVPYLYTPSKNGKKLNISWYSVPDASGYQVYYKSNGDIKTVRVKGQARTNKSIVLASSGKSCVVKIRAYRTEGKKIVYSKWSLSKTA